MMTRIVSPFPKENERFGTSVSLNAAGDCLAVGTNNQVCVYTRRKSGEWNISKPIVFEVFEDEYQRSSWDVCLDAAGDTLALGNMSPYLADNRGRVCVYTRRKGVWDTKNPIQLPIPSDSYEFGWIAHLSAAGNCLAVRDYAPMIYVYTRTNGIWDGENPIKFKVPENNLSLGRAFSLNAEGDRLAVGIEFYNSTDGEVYLYKRTNGIWDKENPIKFSAPASDVTYFGRALELNDAGDRLVVGAYSRVYVYTCLNNKWNMETPMEILDPSDNLSGFGGAVGLNKAGTSLVVGAGPIKLGSESETGAVYVFENVK